MAVQLHMHKHKVHKHNVHKHDMQKHNMHKHKMQKHKIHKHNNMQMHNMHIAQAQKAQAQNAHTHGHKKRERHEKITGPYQTIAGTLMVESRAVRMCWSTLIFSARQRHICFLIIKQKTLGSYNDWIHVWELI